VTPVSSAGFRFYSFSVWVCACEFFFFGLCSSIEIFRDYGEWGVYVGLGICGWAVTLCCGFLWCGCVFSLIGFGVWGFRAVGVGGGWVVVCRLTYAVLVYCLHNGPLS